MKTCIIYFNDQNLQMSLSILNALAEWSRVLLRLIVIMRGQYIKWGGTLKGWGRGGCTVTDLLPFKTLISKGKSSFAAPVHSCTFSIEVEGKSCQKYWLNSSYVIMFFYIYFFLRPLCFYMHWDKEEFDTGHSYRLNS